jgi:hypothetical protein
MVDIASDQLVVIAAFMPTNANLGGDPVQDRLEPLPMAAAPAAADAIQARFAGSTVWAWRPGLPPASV